MGFPSDPIMFRKYFPKAKVIVCNRDPVEALPSYFNLVNIASQSDFDEAFSKRCESFYEHFTIPIYKTFDAW